MYKYKISFTTSSYKSSAIALSVFISHTFLGMACLYTLAVLDSMNGLKFRIFDLFMLLNVSYVDMLNHV